MRYRKMLKSALRNPYVALRVVTNYSKRILKERLEAPWFHARLDVLTRRYVSRRYALQKIFDPETIRGSSVQSDNLLSNKLTVLGKTLLFRDSVNWLADFQGGEWPTLPSHKYNRFYAEDFSTPEYRKHGDVKRVWDLNKHQHFVDLARTYSQSKDSKCQARMVDQFLDWFQRFPYLFGIGWNQPLIVAQRAINWLLCYNLDAFPIDLEPRLLLSLYDHGRYLSDNLEIGLDGWNSNHLIGELAALHLIGLSLQKKEWSERALRMLLEEVEKQVYADGGDYEQSTGYHRYVLEFLTLVWYGNKQSPQLLTDVIHRMSNFLNDIAYGDGTLPFLSDWDGAKVWVFDHHRPSELLTLGKRSPTSIAYSSSGYYVLRGGPFHLVFDCGPIGMAGRRLATHGHSDLLSFCLDVNGEPFIVDPGSGTYTENKQIHDHFRSTAGHNTVTIDNKDQCGLADTWTLEKHPHTRLLAWETSDEMDRVCGEHDGYNPLVHKREIRLLKKPNSTVQIRDEVVGVGEHSYQCYFHLAPNIDLEISSNVAQLNSSSSRLTMEFDSKLLVRKVNGLFAPDYGLWTEAPVLVFEGSSKLPAEFVWKYVSPR